LLCAPFCCSCVEKETGNGSGKNQRLPEVVPTHNLMEHKRPKVNSEAVMTPTTASFMSYAHRHEHPTDLEREVAKQEHPGHLQYVRLDDDKELASASQRNDPVRYNINNLPEQATKM